MHPHLLDKLAALGDRFEVLNGRLSDPEVIADREIFRTLAKERAELEEVVNLYRHLLTLEEQICQGQEVMAEAEEAELRELAREELERLEGGRGETEARLKHLMLSKDPNDERNVILEIRAGTGGEEASLFAAELFRMYLKFAERRGWRVEIMSQHPTGLGGYKEVIASVEGKKVYSLLKHESGTHRVQRVPETETGGRIHTSAVTVAILPQAEEVDLRIDPQDLRIDVFRSSGPGGQSVNTTDSAVRITHLSTGMVVTCQDEKSQHKNRAKALKVLRARLYDAAKQEQEEKRARERRSQVGSGDRSGRIRTYNFPQGRVSDHRINLTLYKLEAVLEGGLEEVIEPLIAAHEADRLAEFETAGRSA